LNANFSIRTVSPHATELQSRESTNARAVDRGLLFVGRPISSRREAGEQPRIDTRDGPGRTEQCPHYGAAGVPAGGLNAANRLAVSRWMVYRLIWDQQVASVQIGRCRRIVRSSFNNYLAGLIEGAA
jgi:excisionase family DNA binding protein